MDSRDLLDDLRDAGFSVALIDDKVIVAPKAKLTDPLRDVIRARRAELVIRLSAGSATQSERPHRLTREQGDACHSPCWDDAEIAAFTARVLIFMRRGIGADDADDLAERLTLRDRDGDDRRLCIECAHSSNTGRCLAAPAGRVPGADKRLVPVQMVLHRCEAFGLRKGLR